MPDIFVEPKIPETKHEARKHHFLFPLAGFALHPEGVHFATQGHDEKIHLFLRKHLVTNVPWILLSLFLLLVPIVIAPFIQLILPFSTLLAPRLPFILTIFYYLVVFGFIILANFINWYFNVYIVTNERVIDVDFINIIYREVSSTRLNLIQDVTVKTGGVARAIFDYGDVFIQTAGTELNFDFHAVPHPQQVAREIEILMQQARKREGISDLEEKLEL